jgi:hypothetical protein
MPDVIDEFVQYFSKCPLECRKYILAQELEQQIRLKDKEHPYPIIELRWLQFHLKKLQNITTSVSFLKVSLVCEGCIDTFVKQHEHDANNLEKLNELIEQQTKLIFNQCVSETLHTFLIHAQKNPNISISSDELLLSAQKLYRNKMYHEALHQYETHSLIERQYFLENRKKAAEADLIYEHMTLQLSIIPELNFISDRLSQNDLVSFKLWRTKELEELFYELPEDLDDPQAIKEKINDFFVTNGETSIDDRVSGFEFASNAGNNIKKRTFNDYYNHSAWKTCSQYMDEEGTKIEKFIKNIELPNTNETLPTRDVKLIKLRELVHKLKQEIEVIEKSEKDVYVDRKNQALENRKTTLITLESSLNRVDKYNHETRDVALKMIDTIKNNGPTWRELHWIDQLLDIITCGAHVLYRNSIFKEHPAAIDLYDYSEKEKKGFDA